MAVVRDYLVIGGGIVGLSVARSLRARDPAASVTVLEKEQECAQHASGRNSGVLHAGFYYSADSLKAKFTRDGNRRMHEYCERKGLAIRRVGKLVVTKNASELPRLDELARRGQANGVHLEPISERDAKRIEPRVKTFERALWSPTTSSVDPVEVTLAIKEDAKREGVEVRTGVEYRGRRNGVVQTGAGDYVAGYVVNCAGLYADKVALDFGFSRDYRILPFKGLYIYSEEPVGAFRTNIYPVPDLRNPFLGVHFTVTVDGHVKIGPTAIPAFWREHYDGLDRFNVLEFLDIAFREAGLFFTAGFDFRSLAVEELQKYSRRRMVDLAGALAEGVRVEDYRQWGKPGIRAQLVHRKERRLEMDFVVDGDAKSCHVLNAVSPGFTCALPFADHVVDQIGAWTNS